MKFLKFIRNLLIIGLLTICIAAGIWAVSILVTKFIFFVFALGYFLHMLGIILIALAASIVIFYLCKWMGIID